MLRRDGLTTFAVVIWHMDKIEETANVEAVESRKL